MEKSGKLTVKNMEHNFVKAVELDCFICGNEETFSGHDEVEIIKMAGENGWRTLESDVYMCIGWWCGCDYSDEIERDKIARNE